jgi:excisionase family DNA binding protein
MFGFVCEVAIIGHVNNTRYQYSCQYLFIDDEITYGRMVWMDKILSVQQAAERLGVTPDMIRKAIRQGRLKAQSLSQKDRRPYYIVTETALQEYQRRPKGKPGRRPRTPS